MTCDECMFMRLVQLKPGLITYRYECQIDGRLMPEAVRACEYFETDLEPETVCGGCVNFMGLGENGVTCGKVLRNVPRTYQAATRCMHYRQGRNRKWKEGEWKCSE